MVEEKISLAACNGMSATGLISRVAVADLIDEDEKLISICITATSTDKPAFVKLIKKYPVLGVNGCNNNCVGHILKRQGITGYAIAHCNIAIQKLKFVHIYACFSRSLDIVKL